MVYVEDMFTDKSFKRKLIDIIRLNSTHLDPFPTEVKEDLIGPGMIKSIIFDIYGTLIISDSGDVGTAKGSSKSENFLNALINFGLDPP